MRILIGECLNWRLARSLTGHYAVSTQKMGWGGIKNGALLEKAAKEFDVFITGDRNLSFQQNVKQFKIAVFLARLLEAFKATTQQSNLLAG